MSKPVLRVKYAGIDRSIRWAIDAMYDAALEDIFRDWEKTEPRPTVEETRQMISFHDDGLADAWVEYMEDYEGEEADLDESPQFAQAVEWLVRGYEYVPHDQLYADIDMERGRHKKADTSDAVVENILFRQERALAEGWTEWLRKNR